MKRLLLILAVLIPVFAIAHPGHGVAGGSGFMHMFLSHGYIYVLAILVFAGSYYFVERKRKE